MVDPWLNHAADIWDIPRYALSCCGEGNLRKQTSVILMEMRRRSTLSHAKNQQQDHANLHFRLFRC